MVASELAGSPGALVDRSVHGSDACADCPLVTVLVCRKCKGSERVIDFLNRKTRASVQTVRCQKVCKGPVAGVAVQGRLEWFGKLKGPKQLRSLQRLVSVSSPKKIPKRLRKRRSRERAGCRR